MWLRVVPVLTFLAAILPGAPASEAAAGAVPDFSSGGIGWLNTHNDFIRPAAGPGPVTWDPAHPYFGNGDGPKPTSRVADLTNPILMPWGKDALQKFNADALAEIGRAHV